MLTRAAHATLSSVLLVGLIISGCAKKPATTASAAAPAPSAAPAPAPRATAPSTPAAPSTAAPARAGRAARRPRGAEAFAEGVRGHRRLKDVFFEFDKYDIRPEDAKTLDANASWLKSNAENLVLIEGHCDERGTNEYNLALGERRAKATMNYLVSQGVQANRITIISYGEERPLCNERPNRAGPRIVARTFSSSRAEPA